MRLQMNMEWDQAETFALHFRRTLKRAGLEDLMACGSFLDIGCGDAKEIHEIAKLYPTAAYHGLDGNPDQVEEAKRNNPKADIMQGYFDDMPFTADSFTVISSRNIFTFAKDEERSSTFGSFNVEDLSGEVYRVLKRGGIYCVQEVFYKNLLGRIPSSGLVLLHRDEVDYFRIFRKPSS